MGGDKPLTTGQAAKALGVSKSTLLRRADEGLISCWRVPGSDHRRFSANEIRRVRLLQEYIQRVHDERL